MNRAWNIERWLLIAKHTRTILPLLGLLEITDLSACSPAVGVPIPWISGGRLVNGEAGKVEPAMCHCHVDANDYDVTRPDLTDVC